MDNTRAIAGTHKIAYYYKVGLLPGDARQLIRG